MDISAFGFFGSVWHKEEIPLVIHTVPFSLYVLKLMRKVFYADICTK